MRSGHSFSAWRWICILSCVLGLAALGCAEAKKKPVAEKSGKTDSQPKSVPKAKDDSSAKTTDAEPAIPVAPPEPLVENKDKLQPLDENRPVWVDPENKHVVLVGTVCQSSGPLEMFACVKNTKEHESIVTCDIRASYVHAGLLAIGAESGKPVQFAPEYKAASGSEIDITVIWKDEDGKVQSAKAQDWIRDKTTGKALAAPFVFGGSRFYEDPDTKEKFYMADGGEFICVSNFPSAMLDLPIKSSDVNADLEFDVMPGKVPPKGTQVTMLLKPKPPKPAEAKPEATKPEETKPEETKPVATKPVETKPVVPVEVPQPLVENVDKLKPLAADQPSWVDPGNEQVVLVGTVCQTKGPLELFACLKNTKEHESILSCDVSAAKVHAALVAIGAQPGSPVRFVPEFKAASGSEIDITVIWKDEAGKVQSAKAQDWIRDKPTGQPLAAPFVFGGSRFYQDPETKEEFYLADGGEFICVSNFQSAMLDLPIKSSEVNADLQFDVMPDKVPPLGTPVTVLLKPKLKK